MEFCEGMLRQWREPAAGLPIALPDSEHRGLAPSASHYPSVVVDFSGRLTRLDVVALRPLLQHLEALIDVL